MKIMTVYLLLISNEPGIYHYKGVLAEMALFLKLKVKHNSPLHLTYQNNIGIARFLMWGNNFLSATENCKSENFYLSLYSDFPAGFKFIQPFIIIDTPQ